MIEPGPVHTEFEAKMIQEVKEKEYPGTDPDTINYFKNVYLPSSVDIFETLGQTPDEIARVCLQSATELHIEYDLTVSKIKYLILDYNFLSLFSVFSVHQESD